MQRVRGTSRKPARRCGPAASQACEERGRLFDAAHDGAGDHRGEETVDRGGVGDAWGPGHVVEEIGTAERVVDVHGSASLAKGGRKSPRNARPRSSWRSARPRRPKT